jgi:hypothetical protein
MRYPAKQAELARGAEVACTRQDFRVKNPRSLALRTALHVCTQWIYAPGRRRSGGPRWDLVSSAHPLRCVLYHETPPESLEVTRWIGRMKSRYELRRQEPVEVDMSGAKAGPKWEHWVVFEFIPRASEPSLAVAGPVPERIER